MVFVDGNSMSVVRHWIKKRSMLVGTACICSSALDCEKVYVGENSMSVVWHWIGKIVYVGENSMSVVQHWIGKRSMLVRRACL